MATGMETFSSEAASAVPEEISFERPVHTMNLFCAPRSEVPESVMAADSPTTANGVFTTVYFAHGIDIGLEADGEPCQCGIMCGLKPRRKCL